MINRATSQSQSVLRDVSCQDIVVEAQCREPDDGKGASKSAREDGNAEVPSASIDETFLEVRVGCTEEYEGGAPWCRISR